METICMKYQILFSGKNKKYISSSMSAEFAQRVVKVNRWKWSDGSSTLYYIPATSEVVTLEEVSVDCLFNIRSNIIWPYCCRSVFCIAQDREPSAVPGLSAVFTGSDIVFPSKRAAASRSPLSIFTAGWGCACAGGGTGIACVVMEALWACGTESGGDKACEVQIVGEPSPPATIVDTTVLESVSCSSFADDVSMSLTKLLIFSPYVHYDAPTTDAV